MGVKDVASGMPIGVLFDADGENTVMLSCPVSSV